MYQVLSYCTYPAAGQGLRSPVIMITTKLASRVRVAAKCRACADPRGRSVGHLDVQRQEPATALWTSLCLQVQPGCWRVDSLCATWPSRLGPPAAALVDARINLRRGAVPAITWLRYLSRLRCSNGARRPLRVLCVLPAADAQTDRLAGHLGESGGQALSLPGRTANDAAVTVMCSRSPWRPRPSKRIRKSAQLRCTATACHRHGVTNSSAVTRRAWGQAGPPRCQGIALGTVFQERRLVSTVPS